MGRFSFANEEKTGSADLNMGWRNIGSFTAISFSTFGDLRMGNDSLPLFPADTGGFYNLYGRKNYVQGDALVDNANPAVQKNSGYSVFNVLEKLRMEVNSNIALTGALYFSTTGQVPRYDKLIEPVGSALKYAEWYYGPQRWLFSTIAIDYTKPQPLFATAKATIAFQNYQESTHQRLYGSSSLTDSTESVDVVSGAIDCNKPVGDISVLVYGVETSFNTVASTLFPGGSNDVLAGSLYGYLKTRWNSVVTSVAGARYSRVYLHSMQEDTLYISPVREAKINTGAPSGCLGVIVQPFDFWRLTLNGSTGFRAPNVDDMSKIFTPVPVPGYIRVPNNDLQPEYAYTLDFGNQVTLGKNVSLEATTFMTLVDNLMVEDNFTYNGLSSITYNGVPYFVRSLVNKGSANIEGGDVNLEIRFTPGFSMKNTITFTGGLDSALQPLRTVPPLFGASHFLFKIDRVKGDFFVRYNAQKTEGRQPTDMVVSDDETYLYPLNGDGFYFSPSWFTLNLATTTILTKFLDLNLAVENVLNKCYRPYANGIAAPGTSIVCSIKGKI